jgi:hypothetical protein
MRGETMQGPLDKTARLGEVASECERLRDWLLARVDGETRGHYHRIIERYVPDREKAIGHDAVQACSADNRSSRQT